MTEKTCSAHRGTPTEHYNIATQLRFAATKMDKEPEKWASLLEKRHLPAAFIDACKRSSPRSLKKVADDFVSCADRHVGVVRRITGYDANSAAFEKLIDICAKFLDRENAPPPAFKQATDRSRALEFSHRRLQIEDEGEISVKA